jgi:hypothetical protein
MMFKAHSSIAHPKKKMMYDATSVVLTGISKTAWPRGGVNTGPGRSDKRLETVSLHT